MVVDMSLLGQLDHATAASLVALGYELRQSGSQLVLAAVSSSLAGGLARLQLGRGFTIMPDVASALGSPVLFEEVTAGGSAPSFLPVPRESRGTKYNSKG